MDKTIGFKEFLRLLEAGVVQPGSPSDPLVNNAIKSNMKTTMGTPNAANKDARDVINRATTGVVLQGKATPGQVLDTLNAGKPKTPMMMKKK